MGDEAVQAEIRRLEPWFHNLHLPDGSQTCPGHSLGDFPRFKWRNIEVGLPRDLSGWTALDIGCNAGFYSIELARRGAQVTALDVDDHYLEQARWAARQFGVGDRIEFQRKNVYELCRSEGVWDLVLFMGVFYHLRYPLLALDGVSRLVGKLLVFQSMTMLETDEVSTPRDLGLNERGRLTEPGWPKLAFIEHHLADDHTNWWVPNHSCIEALLRSTGLRVLSRPEHEVYLCAPDRSLNSSMWPWNETEYLSAAGLK